MASHPRDWRRLGRLAALILAIFAAILAAMVIPPWVDAFFSRRVLRRALIGFLVGLEFAYVGALVAAAVGLAAFGYGFRRARRLRATRPMLARGLLVCGCGLASLALAEGTAAAWLGWIHRAPSLIAEDPALDGRFDEPADADEVTVTVLGGSSAEGMPYNEWLSVGQIVAWQLGRALPSRRFRVERLAHWGHSLADQHRRLAASRRRPDVLIVYSGHNEFSSNISWSRRVAHYRDERPTAVWTLEEGAARVSPLCALIHETAEKHRVATPPRGSLAPPLVDVPAYTPEEYDARLAQFRRRLEEIVAFGERIRALTVLIIPPANDADFDPNRSALSPGTSRAARAEFAREFLDVRRSEESDPARAIERYRELLRRQPGFAETHYRLGRLLAQAGDWEAAYRRFASARDLDGLPLRCLSAFQQVYRDVAARHRGAILIDGQALFHAIGRHGLLGDDLFHDVMHPSLRGHIALAQAVLEALYARRALGWPEGTPAPLVDPAECATHFGIRRKDWRALAERGAMFYFAVAPLRYDPSQRLARRDAFMAASVRIAAGDPPESVGLPNLGVPATPPLAPDSLARATH